MRRLVTEVRSIRATYEVEPRRRIEVTLVSPSEQDRGWASRQSALVKSLARIERLEILAEAPEQPGTIRHPVGDIEVRIPMSGLFDIAAETQRLGRERLKVDKELGNLRKRLANSQFVEKAKREIVDQIRTRASELEQRLAKIEATLTELGRDAKA
jgi:valyl-tRNA synthetase